MKHTIILVIFLVLIQKMFGQVADTTNFVLPDMQINFNSFIDEVKVISKQHSYTVSVFKPRRSINKLLDDILSKHEEGIGYKSSPIFLIRFTKEHKENTYEIYIEGWEDSTRAYELAHKRANGVLVYRNKSFFLFYDELPSFFLKETLECRIIYYTLTFYEPRHLGPIEVIDGQDSSFGYRYTEGKFTNNFYNVHDINTKRKYYQ